MVIDDWKDTNSYINYLIKNVVIEDISNFYIVIISRNKPFDEYIELELKQKCIIMNKEDIAFNLKLSIVENFTLEQAYYITENRKCNMVIKDLMLNNCFIKFDRKSKLYTLHSIFRNDLEDEMEVSHINFYK